MQAVILVGGFGTRLKEKTSTIPKPMVEVAGRPILWHIMKYYSMFGINDFILCLGYKGEVIKDYFLNIHAYNSDVTVNLAEGKASFLKNNCEPWNVTMIDTGLETATGGRLKKIAPYLDGQAFCMTYGDGVADVDINALLAQHKNSRSLATVTAVVPPSRYGYLEIAGGKVTRFQEKPESADKPRINGGFFILDPKALDYVQGDDEMWEQGPMNRLVADGQLSAYNHDGFWQCMDTLRDQQKLDQLWKTNQAPWRIWPNQDS
ncbi:glucose-1-phosphate cytidylyltransferase [Dasania marina]|uniref:glucose-1-phosphate cytidylyltransferase n=1 Tax=Dasania marina TaxID=471499 RepID=UPI0030D89AA8|tara:strand:- start:35547 stop:36332 length:786 start_codon:yes stop_codon:yes gene_type:complete